MQYGNGKNDISNAEPIKCSFEIDKIDKQIASLQEHRKLLVDLNETTVKLLKYYTRRQIREMAGHDLPKDVIYKPS